MKGLKDFYFKNKRVLVRCDFNVPLAKSGEVLDDFRIRQTLPTIKYLIEKKAEVILMSHLGRPDGKVVEELRLDPVAKRLSGMLGQSVEKIDDCLGREVRETIEMIQPGKIVLLENVQFNPGEKENDLNFAKTLASYADIFILEAFGQAHRNYASIAGIQKYLPSAAGFLLEKEVKFLSRITKSPKRPLVVIIGGGKVKDKAKMAQRFSAVADYLLVGSLVASEIKEKKIKIKNKKRAFLSLDSKDGLDIGEPTFKVFKEKILKAKTVFWAGPLGKIEEKKYQKGTREVARAIIQSRAFSVIGGGDTVEFINKIGLAKKFNHLSTGGGAMLAFLSGEKLPGLKALGYY